jgi:hypothetical protein
MKKVKTLQEFINESNMALNESNHKISVAVDVPDTKKIEDAIIELGGKVVKKTDFGILIVDIEDHIVPDVKKIEGVQYVEKEGDK